MLSIQRPRIDKRIVEPELPDTWTPEEIEWLLWPDTPDHLPALEPEEGWPALLGLN